MSIEQSVANMTARFTNERLGRLPVECLMNRGKLTLVVLLPVVWLFASGESLLASCEECGTRICNSQSILKGGKGCPAQPLSNSDAAASAIHSRVLKHSGKNGLTPCENIYRSFSLQPDAVAYFAPRTNSPDLATSWQFAYRTALDPRAPSFHS